MSWIILLMCYFDHYCVRFIQNWFQFLYISSSVLHSRFGNPGARQSVCAFQQQPFLMLFIMKQSVCEFMCVYKQNSSTQIEVYSLDTRDSIQVASKISKNKQNL